MNYLYERVSYLRGLADGMEIDESSKEGKLLLSVLDVLEDFADSFGELHEEMQDLDEYVETIDEDLSDVEDIVYEDEELDDDEDEYVEVECEHCGEILYIDETLVHSQKDLVCPSCHKQMTIHNCCEHDEHECCK